MAALLSERGKLIVFSRNAAVLLCGFTVFSEILLRPKFVPSDDYIESTWLLYFLITFSFGLINFLSIDYSDFAAGFPRKISPLQYFASRIFLFLLFAGCFQVFLQSSVPSLILRFSGSQIAVKLEVSDLNPNRDRKYCVHGVFLRNKPYFANEVCNITPNVLSRLSADDLIVVYGNGNWMGLIPERVVPAH